MNKYLVGTCIIFVLANSCSNRKNVEIRAEQIKCGLELAMQNGMSSEGVIFREQLTDSLKFWIENVKIDLLESYKSHKYEVGSPVLFDSFKRCGIGLILEYRNSNEVYDVAQIVTGKIIDGKWEFYYLGNFTLLFSKCDDCPEKFDPISKEDIERRAVQNIIGLGYYKNGCEIDNEKFNTTWVSKELQEDHKYKFLSGTYPKSSEK